MSITYWDLKNLIFTARGRAKRVYKVLAVEGKRVLLERWDGFKVETDSDKVLAWANDQWPKY